MILPDLGNFLDSYFPWDEDGVLIPPVYSLALPNGYREVVRQIDEARARLEFGVASATAAQFRKHGSANAVFLADITSGWCEIALGHTAIANDLLEKSIIMSPHWAVRDFLHELRCINFLCVGRYEAARDALSHLSDLGREYARYLSDFIEVASERVALGRALSHLDWVAPPDGMARRYLPFTRRFLGYCDPYMAQLSVPIDDLEVPVLSGENALVSIKHKAVTSTYVFSRELPCGPVIIKLILGYCGYAVDLESREYTFLNRVASAPMPKAYAELKLPRGYVIATQRVDGEPLLPGKFSEAMHPRMCELVPSQDRWRDVVDAVRRQLRELAHHGLYHGDLGPDNILISNDGAHVIDLGLAIDTGSFEEADNLHEADLSRLDTYMTGIFQETCANWANENCRRESVSEVKLQRNDSLEHCYEVGDYTQFQRDIDDIYQSRSQQFDLDKYYQTFRQIGITKAFRDSEERFEFYSIYKLLKKSDSVLDIGSNTGFLSIMHAPFCKEILGIEYNESLVEIANKTALFLGVPNCAFSCTSFQKFCPDKRYDVIFDLAAHGWINSNFSDFFAEVERMLQPRGLFIMESHNLDNSDIDFSDKVVHVEGRGFHLIRDEPVPDTGDHVPRRFCVFVHHGSGE